MPDMFTPFLRTQDTGHDNTIPDIRERDPDKVILLSDMLASGDTVFWPWLDLGIVRERFGTMLENATQAELVTEEALSWAPILCLHAPNTQMDRKKLEHWKSIDNQRKDFKRRAAGGNPAATYTHFDINVSIGGARRSSRNEKTWRPPPLLQVDGDPLAEGRGGKRPRSCGSDRPRPVIVHTVPNWPRVLGVSVETATEYVVRFLVHDFLHRLVPAVPETMVQDELHNALCLHLTAAPGNTGWRSHCFDQLIQEEATDPFFFLTGAERWRRKARGVQLTPFQAWFVERMIEMHCKDRIPRNQQIWGLLPGMRLRDRQAKVRRIVERELLKGDFSRYTAPLDDLQ